MTLRARDVTARYPGRSGMRSTAFRSTLRRHDARDRRPSGAGKTTLLRAIAGLLRYGRGDVELDDRRCGASLRNNDGSALVFQDDALFANMTLRDNLRFAMRDNGRARRRTHRLHGCGAARRRSARQPSSPAIRGERQRAAIARALLSDPAALLLDEPLAHLDPSLRRSVRDEIAGVHQRFAGPIMYVTHDHVDAMSIGDDWRS